MINRALDDEENGLGKLNIKISEETLCYVSEYAGGDIRNALNALEIAVLLAEKDNNALITIDLEIAKQTIQTRNIKYDRTGDEHYHLISALIKSIRGSDPDAALYWISAILEAGEDPNFIFRRLLILASEDIGLAEPNAITIVNSCHEAYMKCGMPEEYILYLMPVCI